MRVDRFVDAYLSRNFCSTVAGSLMYAETALRGLSLRPLVMITAALRFGSSVASVVGIVADWTTGHRDFDSSIASKRSCHRVKSLDGLPSKRGNVNLSSLMFGINSLSDRLYNFP
jgi:hypothetical protein